MPAVQTDSSRLGCLRSSENNLEGSDNALACPGKSACRHSCWYILTCSRCLESRPRSFAALLTMQRL